mmetsp:Transcript_17718/g.45586  ORF Transcript_17718/g.45586 Transcript_17718/m.45586 type:complete len:200 (+) Transcript_17718:344-943(+)
MEGIALGGSAGGCSGVVEEFRDELSSQLTGSPGRPGHPGGGFPLLRARFRRISPHKRVARCGPRLQRGPSCHGDPTSTRRQRYDGLGGVRGVWCGLELDSSWGRSERDGFRGGASRGEVRAGADRAQARRPPSRGQLARLGQEASGRGAQVVVAPPTTRGRRGEAASTGAGRCPTRPSVVACQPWCEGAHRECAWVTTA